MPEKYWSRFSRSSRASGWSCQHSPQPVF